MGIIVENGGILTTVQDEGRFGYQAFGVSTSVSVKFQATNLFLIYADKKRYGRRRTGDDIYRSDIKVYQ